MMVSRWYTDIRVWACEIYHRDHAHNTRCAVEVRFETFASEHDFFFDLGLIRDNGLESRGVSGVVPCGKLVLQHRYPSLLGSELPLQCIWRVRGRVAISWPLGE